MDKQIAKNLVLKNRRKIIFCTLYMFLLALIGFVFYFFVPSYYKYLGFVLAFVGYIILYKVFRDSEFWISYVYSLVIYLIFFLLFFL